MRTQQPPPPLSLWGPFLLRVPLVNRTHETPKLLYPPPLVVPHSLSFPRGGVGDRHLANPKIFVAAHCVVVWVTVLWDTATCIPCTHGGTFCLFSLKWNLTAQPCFPLGPDKCDG